MVSWEENSPAADWAQEMDSNIKALLLNNDHKGLIAYPEKGDYGRLGIPTPDHYLPMLYILGLKGENEKVKFISEEIQNATVSMRSFEFVKE